MLADTRSPSSFFAVMIAFLYSLAAEFVGLSAIVGSFLAGVSLSEVKITRGGIFRTGAEHLQTIFASVLFVSLGAITDLHYMKLRLLWFVLALTAVAIASKMIGCGISALTNRMTIKDSLIVGAGMMPRGEVAMIVALIGLGQGLLSQSMYAALILMSLLSTIIAPLILKNWLFRSGHESSSTKQPNTGN